MKKGLEVLIKIVNSASLVRLSAKPGLKYDMNLAFSCII